MQNSKLVELFSIFSDFSSLCHFRYQYAYMKVTFQIGMCEKNLLCWNFYSTILNIHTCIHFTLHTMEIWNTFEISFEFATKFTYTQKNAGIYLYVPSECFTYFIFWVITILCQSFNKSKKLIKIQDATAVNIYFVDHIVDLRVRWILSHGPQQCCKLLK